MNDDREFEFWLRRATPEQKLNTLLWGQRVIMDAQNLMYKMEKIQMLNLDKMNARVGKISDLATSVKTAYEEAMTARDTAIKERDEARADDADDQAKVDAAEANLATAEALLEALKAVAAGTPVVLPPDTGASTGGARRGE